MAVLQALDTNSFDQALGPRSCVFFWAAWHEPSKPGGQMDEVFCQLSDVYQGSIVCIKVEAESVPEVSERLGVAMVPTFVFLKGSNVRGKLEGADPPALVKRLQDFSNEPITDEAGAAVTRGGIQPKLEAKLKGLVSGSPVMLFMKGNADSPKCKFSRQMVKMLRDAGVGFGSFDILTDAEVRAGLKIFSNWPTFPQLYVRGNFVGGVDDVSQMAEGGSLKDKLHSHAGVKASAPLAQPESVRDRCKQLVSRSETMLFMKGSPDAPRCGFSRSIVGILREEGINFDSFDILGDEEVRQDLKLMSNWPTYPQLYVRGELIGGLDILRELQKEGGLPSQLGVETKESLNARLKDLMSSSRVMLFMKGTPDAPKCGFSRKAVALLQEAGVEFKTFDILQDPDVRQGLKELSNWPTYPQLYVDGKLLGGLDIMQEMAQEDELTAALRCNN